MCSFMKVFLVFEFFVVYRGLSSRFCGQITKRIKTMTLAENITGTLRRGYSIAKTEEQFDRVKYWQDKISKKVTSCHSILDECDRLDREFNKVAKRMGLK